MDRNSKGDFFMFEDEHFFSVEVYDHPSGCWMGMGFYDSRAGVEVGIASIRESWDKSTDYECLVRIVETRTEYV
jgi:hypothetical protein